MVRNRKFHQKLSDKGSKMANKSTESQIKASIKYNKENTVQISLKLNRTTDADLIDSLNRIENKQGYIKDLIRRDIANK